MDLLYMHNLSLIEYICFLKAFIALQYTYNNFMILGNKEIQIWKCIPWMAVALKNEEIKISLVYTVEPVKKNIDSIKHIPFK